MAPSTVSVFRNIERRIGGLVEGAFGRTFRSSVQPVELARKLAKEMDDHRTISIHRVYVPNEYTLYLNPADREQFAAYEEQMTSELAEYLVEHARREGYTTSARPRVALETEADLGVGTFGIAVDVGAPAVEPPEEPMPDVAPVPPPMATMVYAPSPEPEPAVADGTLRWESGEVELQGATTAIGRSSDCDVVLADPNVSRRHAEVRREGDAYIVVDLGSTNGTEVNGQRVDETSLMHGDVIGVGQTRITFERRGG
jgi:Protein of unknown function (DUF3662)/FHA domain